MILIDTSAWIDFFRGRGPLASMVDRLLEDDAAAWCGPVEVELRRGIRSARQRAQVLQLMESCHRLESPTALWQEAGELGAHLGSKGVEAKSMDLLIATYALAHDVALLTKDRDFALMCKVGVPLRITR